MNEPRLDIDAIRNLLRARFFGKRIVHYDSVTSTNDIAKQLGDEGEPEGTVVCAEEQTAGRGRMARAWIAPPYSSVLMSIVLRPLVDPSQLGRLGMAFGLGLAEAVEKETGLNALLKWPNDLVINGKKCAGILAESNIIGEDIDNVVVGTGLNVNWRATFLEATIIPATSIADELKRSFPREPLVASILNYSEDYYLQQQDGRSLRDVWSQRCLTLHHEVHAVTPWGEEHGIAESVDEEGALLVRRQDGTLVTLTAADVSLHTT